jgi:nucleotide-binding universal stress UspA family protein
MNTAVATRAPEGLLGTRSSAGPVLLSTFDVPFDQAATDFAVRAAVEAGRALIVANVVELAYSGRGGLDWEYTPEMEASLLEPVNLALAQGLQVERLRVKSFRRLVALVELARERGVEMLVLGPDRKRVSARLYRKAARTVRDELECLVWVSWDIPSV